MLQMCDDISKSMKKMAIQVVLKRLDGTVERTTASTNAGFSGLHRQAKHMLGSKSSAVIRISVAVSEIRSVFLTKDPPPDGHLPEDAVVLCEHVTWPCRRCEHENAVVETTTPATWDDSFCQRCRAPRLLRYKRPRNEANSNLHGDPTSNHVDYWIYCQGLLPYSAEDNLGKWLVRSSARHITKTWNTIAQAIRIGQIQAVAAKVSTAFGTADFVARTTTTTKSKPNAECYIICVYTSKERTKTVGLQLMPLVRRTIHYKLNETTLAGEYAHTNSRRGQRITVQSCYWRGRGQPSTFEKPKSISAAQSQQWIAEALRAPVQTMEDFTIELLLVGMKYCGLTSRQESKLLVEGGMTRVRLDRDRDNPKDPNAIAVSASVVTSGLNDDEDATSSFDANKPTRIGFVARHQASRLAPWLDSGLVVVDSSLSRLDVSTGNESWTMCIRGTARSQAQAVLRTMYV